MADTPEQADRIHLAREVLRLAASRRTGFALPLPPVATDNKTLAAATLEDLLARQYLVERPIFPNEAYWLDEADPRRTVLVITAVGQRALEADPELQALPRSTDGTIIAEALPVEVVASPPGTLEPARAPKGKLGLVLKAVAHPNGASIEELQDLTGWKPPSVRAALSSGLRAKGYLVEPRDSETGKRYHLLQLPHSVSNPLLLNR